MFDALINYLDKFSPELLFIQSGLLVILSTIFLWLWFYNRRKYHNLRHAIPANVVKNYLDSIIQNSTALKSSLFRGGGMEVSGVPSVMPLQGLMGGEGIAVSGSASGAMLEELNQKRAHIAALEAQLSSAQSAQREIESKLNPTQKNLSNAETRIKELEAALASSGKGGGSSDPALKAELQNVARERDEFRDRLKEFEIISDDLANLKRLQQENEQLKRSLAAQGGAAPRPAPVPEPVPEPKVGISNADMSELLEDMAKPAPAEAADIQQFEDFLNGNEVTKEAAAEEAPAASASPEDELSSMLDAGSEAAKDKNEKTPEDLLSEFEKMLG